MAAAFMRRSVATAGLAVLATLASPLVGGTAFAAGFSGAISSDPADSSGTIAANRPTFIGTYTDNLASGSTITVKQGSTTIACPQTISANTVSCTPAADLVDGQVYDVTSHGISAVDGSTADAPAQSYTIDIPSVSSASPADGGTLGSGNSALTVVYDEAIDTTASHVTVVNSNNNVVPGSTSFSKSGSPDPTAPTDTMSFSASQSLPTDTYTATWHAEAPGNPKAYVDTVIHFTVDTTLAPSAPTVLVAGYYNQGAHWINADNASAVPFSGVAPKGFTVGVMVYDSSTPPLIGSQSPTNLGSNDNLATTQPANCESSVCPWSLTVDTSGTPDRNYKYYVYASSAAGRVPANIDSGDPTIAKDTVAPATPGAVSSNLPAGSNQLNVQDYDADTSTTSWNVDVEDSLGNVHHETGLPLSSTNSGSWLDSTFSVADLNDGGLTVTTYAVDDAGNASGGDNNPLTDPSKESVTLAFDLPASYATVDGQDIPLSELNNSRVKAPSSITIRFNEAVEQYWTDSSGTHASSPVKHYAHICLADDRGLCQGGNPPTVNDDGKGETLSLANVPSDGTYTIGQVTAFASTTPDKTNFNSGSWTCDECLNSQTQGLDPLATFTIDDTGPAIDITAWTPTVTPSNVTAAAVSGTAEPDTRSVQLTIASSAGGSPLVLSQDVAAPADPAATSVDWGFSGIDLSTVRDGTLTISAIGVDAAGNRTAAPGAQVQMLLVAHRSTLTESVSSTKITFGHAVLVSGRLLNQLGSPIADAKITVRPRLDTGGYGTARAAYTDSNGHWQLLFAPSYNTRWYASYAGSTVSPLHDASSVHTARTLVRVAIAFTSPKNKATVGSPVVLKGKVAPNKRGVTVKIYRHTSSGNKLVGKATLNRYSRWSFKLSLPRGTVKLFAVIGNTTGNLGNRTSYLTLRH
ncbi:MAG TPA: copper resistance protein CopC [Mycobacteriales bacterium]|jgi:methionine-rich copper-binding protein CopC|nr:copper resistance protein CopC [Mycobacteriales bacterium]